MYSKFKDCDPLETANRFYDKLLSLGLDIEIKQDKVAECVYSCTIKAKNINFETHGKGTSEIYALASGLAEMIERIQGWMFIKKMFMKDRNLLTDYKLISINDVFKDCSSLFYYVKKSYSKYNNKKECSVENIINLLKNINVNFSENNNLRCVPFYSTKEKCLKYLPFDLIKSLSGSNGNASGNTYEECLVQAISELIERYAFQEVLLGKLTPPEIPIEWIKKNSPENYERLKELKRITKFDFTVYDCSLGKGFPTVCLFSVDKSANKYSIFAGSHPLFDIALERCITEMFQDISTVFVSTVMERGKSIFEEENDSNELINKDNITNHNYISLPYEFFRNKPSWKFKEWDMKEKDYDNIKGLKFLISLIEKESNETLYIRNLSFLGIPTFFVFSPKFSISNSLSEKSVKDKLFYKDLRSNLKNKIYFEQNKKDLIDFLKNISFNIQKDVNILISSLYFELKDYDNSLKYINLSNDNFAKLVKKEIELTKKGFSIEDKNCYLNKFFDECDINYLNEFWRKNEIFLHLFKNGENKISEDIENNIKNFIEKLNEIKLSNPLDQMEIDKILK